MQYDVFISHASEDKVDFVEPLVAALKARGLSVWYDQQQIQLGDDFRRKMDEGLAASRFGVVVLSPSFHKYWPEVELSAFFHQERLEDEKRILPVVHNLSSQAVAQQWPLLAARASVASSAGEDAVADQIAAVVKREPAPLPQAPSSLFGLLPTRSVIFLGRDEALLQLEELLKRSGSVRIAPSLEGLAGVGKTELALQLVHRLAACGVFPGGIYWLPAENPDLTSTWGGVIADQQGLPQGPIEERANQALLRVSRLKTPVLVVLDNVATWGAAKPYPLPVGSHIRFLVTTRQRRLGGTEFQHQRVGFLERSDAQELLTTVAERDLEGLPGLDPLLKYLDGHALALQLAGAVLAEFPEDTPESYLAALDSNAGRGGNDDHQLMLKQTFGAMWDRLDEDVRSAWRLAAYFEPEPVRPELSDAVGLDRERRRRLRRLHLIESDLSGLWQMHRLTRQFGRSAEPQEDLDTTRNAYILGCTTLSESIQLADGFRLYLRHKPHLDAAVQMAMDLGDLDERSCQLLNNIGTGRQSAGDPRGAKPLMQQALDSDRLNLGEDHPVVAIRRSNLATVLQSLGDLPAARDLLEKALESALQNLGEDHPIVALRRSKLAGVLQDLGDLPAARDLLEKALKSDLQNFGEDHPSVAIRRSNLATVLQSLGDLPAARDLLENALESALLNLGEDHPIVAYRRSKLALVLRNLEEPVEAKATIQTALQAVVRQPENSYYRVNVERIARSILQPQEEG